MNDYTENLKESPKIATRISEFSKVRYKVSIWKSILCLYAGGEQLEIDIFLEIEILFIYFWKSKI